MLQLTVTVLGLHPGFPPSHQLLFIDSNHTEETEGGPGNFLFHSLLLPLSLPQLLSEQI